MESNNDDRSPEIILPSIQYNEKYEIYPKYDYNTINNSLINIIHSLDCDQLFVNALFFIICLKSRGYDFSKLNEDNKQLVQYCTQFME